MGGLCTRQEHPPDYESLLGGYGPEVAVIRFREFHRKHFNLNLIRVLEEFYEKRDRQWRLDVQEEFTAALMHLIYTDDLFHKELVKASTFVFPGQWNEIYSKEAPVFHSLAQKVLLHSKNT